VCVCERVSVVVVVVVVCVGVPGGGDPTFFGV